MPKKSSITAQTEIVTASWDSARTLWNAAQAHARASVAAQIMLGWELTQIKKDLGFTHGGIQYVLKVVYGF